jgi:DnaJ-class molecular chaperone
VSGINLELWLAILGYRAFERPTGEELKKKWKTLCKKHHPDMPDGDEVKFKEVTHAYKMLTDMSYRYAEIKRSEPEKADIVARVNLTFEEACFGTEFPHGFAIRADKETLITDSVMVCVPAGAFALPAQLFRGKGFLRSDGTRGDMTVLFSVANPGGFKPVPTYQPFKWDIHTDVDVPIKTLISGGKIDVLTIWGMRKAKIPYGSQPGSTVTLSGRGVNGADHVATLRPLFPGTKTLKEDSFWSKFGINYNETHSGEVNDDDERDDSPGSKKPRKSVQPKSKELAGNEFRLACDFQDEL